MHEADGVSVPAGFDPADAGGESGSSAVFGFPADQDRFPLGNLIGALASFYDDDAVFHIISRDSSVRETG